MSKTKEQILRIIFVDIVVLIVLFVNLIWIVFDSIYAYEPVNNFLHLKLTGFHAFYLPLHKQFWLYDLYFVGFYFIEIIFQWILAIKNKDYEKWYYYPIMHWYDVLGSIPVGSLRWLRLLRVVSIFVRLSKLQLIDISKNLIFKQFNRLINILSEEVSDRVVVNIISGVQTEIGSGTPVFDKINSDIILPRKENLIEITTNKVKEIFESFSQRFDQDLKEYVDVKVQSAVKNSNDIKTLSRIPLIGSSIESTLKNAISDIVHQIVVDVVADLKSDNNTDEIKEIISLFYDGLMAKQNLTSAALLEKSIIDSLEIIKDQVKVQQWKLNDLKSQKGEISESLNNLEPAEKEKRLRDIKKIEEKMKNAVIKLPLFKVDGEYIFIEEGDSDE